MSYACYECGAKYKEKQEFCSGCFEFKTVIPAPEEGKVFFQRRNRKLMSSRELANQRVKGARIKGFEFFGVLPDKWILLLWGLPGAGKTTTAFRVAEALGRKTLFCSIEQGHSDSLVKMLVDWEIRDDKIFISDAANTREIRQDLQECQPDLLVIDSITTLGATLGHDRVIWIVQATKDGGYRGSLEVSHDADVVCCIEDKGKANVVKNRFGDVGVFLF